MNTAKEWNDFHKRVCFNHPAVNGQMLPNPDMIDIIKQIQLDAAKWGAEQAAQKLDDSMVIIGYHPESFEWAFKPTYVKQSILTFANNLTIDQLRK